MKRFSKFIPMAVIALGIVGALSSFTTSKDSINIPGFVKLNPAGTQCNTSIMCSDDVGPLCTSGTTQIWGKDASGKCVVELYRNHN